MTDKTTDRRVRRTRRALQDALIQLILEQSYDSVTIEEITDHADLGRTTFYLHFKDKEELLMHAIDTICEDFLEKHSSLLASIDNPENDFKKLRYHLDDRILYQIFVHARDNADLYKVMLRGEGGPRATRRFSNIIRDETVKRLKKLKSLEIKVPADIFAIYFSGMLMELVTWWLEEEQPYSIEEMVAFFQQMFIFGALDTLSIDKPKTFQPTINNTGQIKPQ
ncbi:MAG: TetR/AcrR family transcriptional regulator [Brevefilum sp.]